jgi:integrase
VPLRGDLTVEVGDWLGERLEALRSEAESLGEPVPVCLPPDTKLFDVPQALVKIFDRDLILAGIPKRDERGRTVDVHALRTTFGTHLSKGGVSLRTAQAALRHSDPKLTANVYTDPQLLDVKGALDSLPELPLTGPRAQREAKAANQESYSPLAPTLAPTPVESCISGVIA